MNISIEILDDTSKLKSDQVTLVSVTNAGLSPAIVAGLLRSIADDIDSKNGKVPHVLPNPPGTSPTWPYTAPPGFKPDIYADGISTRTPTTVTHADREPV